MYKGKFDQKNKKTTTDVQELLAQRAKTPVREIPEEAPVRKSEAVRKAPAQDVTQKAAPARKPQDVTQKAAPARKAPAQETASRKAPAKKKKGPRLGGVIFYTIYFLFILVFFVGTYIGLQFVQDWLIDFELAQPTTKSQQVFNEVFTDPDWDALYDASGAQDSPYEGKEAFVAYMEAKVGDSELTYMKTSAGLSKDQKYVVMLGDEKIATFTLVDKNGVGETSLQNLTELPDWQLGAVEVFFERNGSYLIEKVDGHTAMVNGVPLTENMTIQVATTIAEYEGYLPAGTKGASMCTQQVTGLLNVPVVTIFDQEGNQMEVTYDEETRTFTERTSQNTMADDEREVAVNAAQTYCLWMIEEVKSRATLAKFFDTSGDPYNTIIRLGELWMQGHNGYEFVDVKVDNYAKYTDELFSVRVSMTLNVTRKDGTVKDYGFDQAMFFTKESGKWLCYAMTNKDVSQPVGKVRLTFMQGDTLINTDLYKTDADQIITPVIPAPEGKVFSGWVTITQDESGKTIYTLVFQPDETGTVLIPEGTYLEPMTLYALFQDADEVAAPDATEGE